MTIFKKLKFSINKIYELIKIRCRYQLTKPRFNVEPSFVQLIDGTIYHGGLADRINSIITAYGLVKAIGGDYKLVHTQPFNLEDYLRPATHNWIADSVCRNIWQTQIIRFKTTVAKPFTIDRRKQQHGYFHCDALESINNIYNQTYTYSQLFNELFVPSGKLQSKIDFHISNLPDGYEAVVFRFQNLLADFYEGPFRSYSIDKQRELIVICLNYLKERTDKRVLVTSDSVTFIKLAAELENVYVIEGNLSHMQYDQGTYESNEKSFIDFFMLTRSSKITLVIAKDMYNSGFPRVAALVGNIKYEITHL